MLNLKSNDIDSLQNILSQTLSRLKRPRVRPQLAPLEHRVRLESSDHDDALNQAIVDQPLEESDQEDLDLEGLTQEDKFYLI